MTHITTFSQSSPAPLCCTDNTLSSIPDIAAPASAFPAAGPLPIPMTNDYLFRALLQRNNKVLKGLVCSLLHLSPEQVCTAEITNPIELGASITDKTFILDIKVLLNDRTVLNLEMQVINQHNWVDRSLSYLCRNFDSLQSGEPYQAVKPVLQIGLLNFTLFPEHPEFYATYQFLNVKNYSLYSDKLRISVLDLTQIELAAQEDKSYHLDAWAHLFKATTWEELTMFAQDEYIKEAVDTIFQLCQDERIRMECEAREDYYRTQLGIQQMMDSQTAALESQAAQIEMQNTKIESQNAQIELQAAQIESQATQIESRNAQIESQAAQIESQTARIESQTTEIESQNAQIELQATEIESRNAQIESQTARIESQATEIESQTAQINKLQNWMRMHGYDPAEL